MEPELERFDAQARKAEGSNLKPGRLSASCAADALLPDVPLDIFTTGFFKSRINEHELHNNNVEPLPITEYARTTQHVLASKRGI
jgi:hypothetical protein